MTQEGPPKKNLGREGGTHGSRYRREGWDLCLGTSRKKNESRCLVHNKGLGSGTLQEQESISFFFVEVGEREEVTYWKRPGTLRKEDGQKEVGSSFFQKPPKGRGGGGAFCREGGVLGEKGGETEERCSWLLVPVVQEKKTQAVSGKNGKMGKGAK